VDRHKRAAKIFQRCGQDPTSVNERTPTSRRRNRDLHQGSARSIDDREEGNGLREEIRIAAGAFQIGSLSKTPSKRRPREGY
jgi:hypothetical protein